MPERSDILTGRPSSLVPAADQRGCLLSGGGPGFTGLDVKQFDRIDLGGFGDSIADSSVIISPAQRITLGG
jgi:hypothetical protein